MMKREILLLVLVLTFHLSDQDESSISNEARYSIESDIETSNEDNYLNHLSSFYGDDSDYDDEKERDILKPVNIALIAMYAIITVVGLLANGIVFFVIFGRGEISKTVTAMYVVQLAFADSLFLLSVPIFGMQLATHNWSFGSALCSICTSLKFFNCYAGVFFLTAMSVDRYIAVAHSITGTQLRTRKRTLIACVILWMLSAIMSFPTLVFARTETIEDTVHCRLQFPGYKAHLPNDTLVLVYDSSPLQYYEDSNSSMEEIYKYDEDVDGLPNSFDYSKVYINMSAADYDFPSCKSDHGHVYNAWIIVHFVVGFFLPFVIITISYILIVKHLQSREASASSSTRRNSQTRRKKVTRTVAALVVCFAICWLPYHLFMLMKIVGFSSYVSVCFGIEEFVIALAYSNSAFNPILYTFLGHNFKDRFRESVNQTKRRWRRSSLPTATAHHTKSHSDQGNNSFSKKFSNMAVFRKTTRPHTSVGSDNVFLETFGARTKRTRIGIPLLDSNKKREQTSGSDHHLEQWKH